MKLEDARIEKMLDLDHTEAKALFDEKTYPWEVLGEIKEFIVKYGMTLSTDEYLHPEEDIWIHKSAKVFPSACIGGPCIIGEGTEVRHCAFIRGSAFIGRNCVVGNSTELKNVILFDNVQVPHYNYVGDSVLGYKSHMGAGSITSNVKSDKQDIVLHFQDRELPTNRHKFGAILGNLVEVGCGSVLNPGTVIGAESNIYPLSSVRCAVDAHSIYKKAGEVVVKLIQ